MKVLLDTCVGDGVWDELITAGYDVIWSRDWIENPGDEQILTTHLNGSFSKRLIHIHALCLISGSSAD